jgi:DNA-3-methyladenine glycosylase II
MPSLSRGKVNTAQQLARAEVALVRADSTLGQLIELPKPISREPRSDYFFSLCRSIVGQQVSVRAAAAIFALLEQATGLEPEAVVKLNDDQIKSIGLSRQKAAYIRDLAAHFVKNPKLYNHLDKLSDDQVIADLTAIKGIGIWTAQMFLMFTLGRLDIFAPDDIGLQRAIKQLYNFKTLPPRQDLIKLAEKWRPYRTVACWHLWESLHNEPS